MKKVVCLLMAVAMIFSCLCIGNVFAESASIGVKFIASTNMGNGTNGCTRVELGLTSADVVDNKITVEYNIINPNDYDIDVMVYLQDGWTNLGVVGDSCTKREIVAAKSELTFTLTADVVEGKIPYGSANAELSAITLRIDSVGRLDKDDFFIVECAAGDPVENMTSHEAWGGALVTFAKATEADLPQTVAAIGVKYVATTDVSFSFTRVNLGLTAQDVVNNEITVSYVVINPNDYEVEVNLHLQNEWDVMSEVGADDNKKVLIPAFGEETITLKQTVTDGAVNYTKQDGSAGSVPLSAITLRVDCSSALNKDDFFILKCDENDPIRSMQSNPASWGGLTTAIATEADLPAAATTAPAVTTAPAATTAPATTTAPAVTTAPVATATPAPAKKVTNGNAENGMTNWGTIHGGSAALVQPGANGTGNAVQATISGTYHSIAFDLGPAIIDRANGYDGAGVGKYILSFYAKADKGKSGTFNVVINSKAHYNGNQISDVMTGASGTYITINPAIELTDQWEKYTVQFEINQKYLDTLTAIYNSDLKDAKSAYEVVLRLDGSTGAYADDSFFGYCVDEVELIAPEKVDTSKTPTGISVEAVAPNEDAFSNFFKSAAGVASMKEVKDGELTKTLRVRNDSEEKISLRFTMQAVVKVNGQEQWLGPNDGAPFTDIEPGEVAELEFILTVEDEGIVYVNGEEVKLSEFFYRLDLKNEAGESFSDVGTKFTIFCTGSDYEALSALDMGTGNWSKTTVYSSAPSGTGDMTPVVIISTLVVATVALMAIGYKKKEN